MPVLNRVWRNNILLGYILKRKYEISPGGFQIFQCSQDTLSSCIAVTKRLYLKGSSPYERNLRRPRGLFSFCVPCTMSGAILSVFGRLTLIATGIGVCFASPGKPFTDFFTVVRKLS